MTARRAAALFAALLLALILAAPLAGSMAAPVYAAFSWICHQRPDRCWRLADHSLPVCVRCLGLYAGALAGAAAGWRFSRPLLLGSAALAGADWLAEAGGWLAPPSATRFLCGFLLAATAVPAIWAEPRPALPRRETV